MQTRPHRYRKIGFRFSKRSRFRRLQRLWLPICLMCKILKMSGQCLSQVLILPPFSKSHCVAWGTPLAGIPYVDWVLHVAHNHRPFSQFCLQRIKSMRWCHCNPLAVTRSSLEPTVYNAAYGWGQENYRMTSWLARPNVVGCQRMCPTKFHADENSQVKLE